jgi:hypothetical protein
MAAHVFNVSLGKVVEYHIRAQTQAPAYSGNCLCMAVLAAAGLESDAILLDKDWLGDVIQGTTNLATNATVKAITAAQLTVAAPDNTLDVFNVDMADVAFGTVNAGDTWSKIIIGWSPDGLMANLGGIIPMTMHDVNIVPDGSTITIQIPILGYYQAGQC